MNSDFVLALAYDFLERIDDLAGSDADRLRLELQRLLDRAGAGEDVDLELRTWFTENEIPRDWAADFLSFGRAPVVPGDGEGRVTRGFEPVNPPPAAPAPHRLHEPEPEPFDDGGHYILPNAPPAPALPHVSEVRRTPHLDAPAAISTAPGATFAIEVWTDADSPRGDEIAHELVLRFLDGVDQVSVGVVVAPGPHFRVDGPPNATLVIVREPSASERVSFNLIVTGDGPAGEAGIVVFFHDNGRPLGSVSRRWSWDPAEPWALAEAVEEDHPEPAVELHEGEGRPDLTVIVTAASGDGAHFACTVISPHLEAYAGAGVTTPWVLPDAQRVAEFVTARLEGMIRAATPAERKDALMSAGAEFYDAAPEPFRDALEQLIRAGVWLRSIYVVSAEPTMPWELMIPELGDDEVRQPLGVEFAVSRWVRRDVKSPPRRVDASSCVLVAPEYSEQRRLDGSRELELFTARLHGRTAPTSSVDKLDSYLGEFGASVVHFVCHGSAASEDEAIYLDGDTQLRAGVVRIKSGFRKVCRSRPFIFLNSCETGRNRPSLGGATGFPKIFGELGAAAVIAPIWSVRDDVASEVALELYERALDEPNRTLAELVRDIRAHAFDPEKEFEDSFAAYCYYGDPAARLEFRG